MPSSPSVSLTEAYTALRDGDMGRVQAAIHAPVFYITLFRYRDGFAEAIETAKKEASTRNCPYCEAVDLPPCPRCGLYMNRNSDLFGGVEKDE